MSQIRVVLADDHGLIRKGIRKLLEDDTNIAVLDEVSNGEELLKKIKHGLRPDVVLMDIQMPHMSGIDATRKLFELLPEVAVVCLTSMDEDEQLVEMFDAGASGFLLKDTSRQNLVETIKLAAENKTFYDADMMKRIRKYHKNVKTKNQAITHMGIGDSALTRRELDVMVELLDAKTNKEIAQSLCISERTVQTHLSNIFNKMGVGSRTEAAMRAISLGLISTDSEYSMKLLNKTPHIQAH
ncbi:MAG: response regulator transcription factor [Chloroflexota bacterium]